MNSKDRDSPVSASDVMMWSGGNGGSRFSKNACGKSYGGSSNGGNGERYGIVSVGVNFLKGY